MATIACVGHTTLDIIFFLKDGHLHDLKDHEITELCLPFSNKIAVNQRVISLGGNAPNVGVSLSRSGHRVVLISQIGIGVLGDLLYHELRDAGFDLTYLSREGETDSSVILGYQGDRTILAYHSGIRYSFPTDLESVDYLYLTSLGFSDYHQVHHPILCWLNENPHTQLVYNPGRIEVKDGFEQVEGVFRAAHTVIVNKYEAQRMLSLPVQEELSPIEVGKIFENYIHRGIRRMVITDNRNGAYFSDGLDRVFHIPTLEVDVVDATGAGDAFSGGYLLGIIAGWKPLAALKLGIAQASQVITKPGATHGLLTLAELEGILARNRQIEPQPIHVK